MKNILNITLRDFAGPFIQFVTNLLGDDGETWWNGFKRFLRKENPWETVKEVVQVVKSVFSDMITAGKYDWVNSSITEENFPMPANFVLGLEPKVFHFGRYISSENAIKEMDAKGFRPATIFDLLDFGAKNPEEQRKYPIVALGSVAVLDDYRYVAYLRRSGSGRHLYLLSFGGEWNAYYRFLGVRK